MTEFEQRFELIRPADLRAPSDGWTENMLGLGDEEARLWQQSRSKEQWPLMRYGAQKEKKEK